MTESRPALARDDLITTALLAGFEAAEVALAIVGPDDFVVAGNAAFMQFFGKDCHGAPFAKYFENDIDARRALIELRDGDAAKAARLVLQDGRLFPALISAFRFPTSEAGQQGLLLTISDDALEFLTRSQTMRERQTALERLAGGMAHDFRNVLAVIKGNIELVEQRSNDPRVKSLLIEADRAAELGSSMTDALLAFARRRSEPAGRLDPGAALTEGVTLLRAAAGPAITLEIRNDAPLGSICADATELQRALVNLVANARDANGGHGAIMLIASNVDFASPQHTSSGAIGAGSYVRISVTDSGPGMTEAVMRRAIEPFFTTKAPGQGFGLGLALVHGFAVDAGGGLDLISKPGQGATATMYLRVR